MSIYLGPLYHWTPSDRRAAIRKRGLLPRTDTVVCGHPIPPNIGHVEMDHELETVKAVCLATSPALAWALSGVYDAKPGDLFDCWEVNLCDDDEVHVQPEFGVRMDEVRVLGRIPVSRLWLIGQRTCGRLRFFHA